MDDETQPFTFTIERATEDQAQRAEMTVEVTYDSVAVNVEQQHYALGASAYILLNAVEARQMAAALMDAADEAEANPPYVCDRCDETHS